MKTVFIPSQFNTLEDLREMKQQPDIIAENLKEVADNFNRIINANIHEKSPDYTQII
jgi:hypothetical protein